MKEETFDQLQKRIPERIIEHAVRGMLPKGRVRYRLLLAYSIKYMPFHCNVCKNENGNHFSGWAFFSKSKNLQVDIS
jgi:hypothetical protein